MGCLYRIDFPSGKSYIGITSKTAEHRFIKGHCNRASNFAVHGAIKKYGIDAARLSTIVIADDWEYLCELEKKAIAAYETLAPNGYNLTAGGEGVIGLKMSEEAKAKMSEAKKGKPSTFSGKKHSASAKEKLRAANLGKKQSQELIAKRTAWQLGHKYDEAFCAKVSAAKKAKNFKFSEESKEKMRLSHLGHKQSPESIAKRKATIAAKKEACNGCS